MPRLKIAQYTLVQHSGFRHDPGFAQAVEEAVVSTEAELAAVKKAGGVLFQSYRDAAKAEYEENYPKEAQGMYPKVRGTFATSVLDGRKIYVPKAAAKAPAAKPETKAEPAAAAAK